MSIFLNILIIILVFIIFLSIYLLTIRRENTMERQKLQTDSSDYEVSEEPGITGIKSSTVQIKKEEKYNWGKKELKYKYNKTFVRLFSRDSNNLFAYWEITEPEYYQNQPVLRLFNESNNNFRDIDISHHTDNWYITRVKEKNKYKVAIGYKKDNIFYPLCYSNTVNTPPCGPSEIIDEKWMSIEELSKYTYRIDINSTLSLIKSLQKRKRKEELKAGSLTYTRRK